MAGLVLALAWVAAAAALAADGRIEINQTAALAGGVTPGDAAGFPVTLSQRGSYVLTGSLTVPNANTSGIRITASEVTLDLNGFSIIGPNTRLPNGACTASGLGNGIEGASGLSDVRVANGQIRGMGFHGIDLFEASPAQARDLTVDQNCGQGVRVGFISFVSNVQARLNGGNGIYAANGSLVHDSIAQYNGYSGIYAGPDSTVRNCVSAVNQTTGIVVDGAGIVHKNIAVSNGSYGIFAGPDATLITDNVSRLNGAAGIYQTTDYGKAGTGGHGGNLTEQNAGGTIVGGTALGCNLDSLTGTTCPPP